MISIKNVSLVFQGGSVAISNISTKVEEGEFVYLVGHSGSGKSSFLKLLYKEYIATKGEIEVANIDVSKLPKWKIPLLRRKIGIVTQEPQLLENRNTFENISFALEVMGSLPEEIDAKTNTLLDLVELNENAYKYPGQLSGGEATRVSIARALANNPVVLLRDEPTGNLDALSAQNVFEILYKLVKSLNISCVFATHNNDLAKLMDRKIVLKHGSIYNE